MCRQVEQDAAVFTLETFEEISRRPRQQLLIIDGILGDGAADAASATSGVGARRMSHQRMGDMLAGSDDEESSSAEVCECGWRFLRSISCVPSCDVDAKHLC